MKFWRSPIKLSAYSIVVILTIYYLIILSHWEIVLNILIQLFFTALPPIFLYVIIFIVTTTLLLSVPLYLKVRYEDIGISLLIFAVTLVIILGFGIAKQFPASDLFALWFRILNSEYLIRYNRLWIAIVSGVFYFAIFERIRTSGNIYNFLDDFKAFPLFSPIFCFGAPAFWEKSLLALGIQHADIRSLGIVSIVAGISFLVALVLFYVSRNINKASSNQAVPNLILPHKNNNRPTNIQEVTLSLFMTMVGLAGITYVSIEIAYLVLRS